MFLEWTLHSQLKRQSIIAYIAEDDFDAALRMDKKLQDAAESLLIFPRKGPQGRIPDTRDLFVPPKYRIIYRIDGEKILILTILHTSQSYPKSVEEF